MSVLILAQDLDASADMMVTALRERGVVVWRVNTAWFPQYLRVTATLHDGRWAGQLITPRYVVDLDRIEAVWYRSPEAFSVSPELSPAEQQHCRVEAKYGLGGVLASLAALWVNHPSRLADAAYKPVQLALAREVGLRAPDTLITNDPEDARRFVRSGRTVTKLLGPNTISESSQRKLSFTQVITPDDCDDSPGFRATTHLFQRWVPKAWEARVIVVGDLFTAVRINAASDASYIDWRADYPALGYEVIELPADVESGIRALMSSFGLLYGALDFAITPDHEWVFLEINPGGQYGWLESATRIPFTGYLADLLMKGLS